MSSTSIPLINISLCYCGLVVVLFKVLDIKDNDTVYEIWHVLCIFISNLLCYKFKKHIKTNQRKNRYTIRLNDYYLTWKFRYKKMKSQLPMGPNILLLRCRPLKRPNFDIISYITQCGTHPLLPNCPSPSGAALHNLPNFRIVSVSHCM